MRYKLPASVAGAEVVVMESAQGIVNGKVEIHPGKYLTVVGHVEDLDVEEDPLPEEPTEVGVAYRVGIEVYQRGDPEPSSKLPWGGRWDWQDWATLCERSMRLTGAWPVRLVPDPAVGVELPWRIPDATVSTTYNDSVPSNGVYVSTKPASYGFAHLRPKVARDMAAALLAAAAEAERHG